jgi:hypothetical protein
MANPANPNPKTSYKNHAAFAAWRLTEFQMNHTRAFIRDCRLLRAMGGKPVFRHGGGPRALGATGLSLAPIPGSQPPPNFLPSPLRLQGVLPMNLDTPASCRRLALSPSKVERAGLRGPLLPWGSGAQSASNCQGVFSCHLNPSVKKLKLPGGIPAPPTEQDARTAT